MRVRREWKKVCAVSVVAVLAASVAGAPDASPTAVPDAVGAAARRIAVPGDPSATTASPGFIENRGQYPADVLFAAPLPGGAAWVTADGFRLAGRGGASVRMSAGRARTVRAERERACRVSDFRGGRRVAGARTFARVVQEDVAPGVDLVGRFAPDGAFAWDLVVAPGADPAGAVVRFDDARRVVADAAGHLVVTAADGTEIRHAPPVLYQVRTDGSADRVDGAFRVLDDGGVGFRVGEHDPARPLVIDPIVGYAARFGGTGPEELRGIAVDPEGFVTVCGTTESADFLSAQSVSGSADATFGGVSDVFVGRVDRTGASLVWITYLGGAGLDEGWDCAVDPFGNAYVVGETRSDDFPVSQTAPQSSYGGTGAFGDGFLAVLSADGTQILTSTYIGGSAGDVARSVAVVGSTAHVVGLTDSGALPAFDPGAVGPGGRDAFLVVFDPLPGKKRFARVFGGSDLELGLGVGVGPGGVTAVAGRTRSAGFPLRNAFQSTLRGGDDGFVTVFDKKGKVLLSSFVGTTADDEANDCAFDTDGNVYVTGWGSGPDLPGASGFDTTQNGGTDAFVVSATTAGSLRYATWIGGSSDEEFVGSRTRCVADPEGRCYVAGSTESSDFPLAGSGTDASGGGTDAFLAVLAPDGASLEYATRFGGTRTEFLQGLDVHPFGVCYLGGSVFGTATFPHTEGAFGTTARSVDAWIAAIETGGGVTGDAEIKVKPRLNLGTARVGDRRTLVVPIRNRNKRDFLKITIPRATPPFETVRGAGSHVIPPRATVVLELAFTPTAPGPVTQDFEVLVEDAEIPRALIQLSGKGK